MQFWDSIFLFYLYSRHYIFSVASFLAPIHWPLQPSSSTLGLDVLSLSTSCSTADYYPTSLMSGASVCSSLSTSSLRYHVLGKLLPTYITATHSLSDQRRSLKISIILRPKYSMFSSLHSQLKLWYLVLFQLLASILCLSLSRRSSLNSAIPCSLSQSFVRSSKLYPVPDFIIERKLLFRKRLVSLSVCLGQRRAPHIPSRGKLRMLLFILSSLNPIQLY